MAKILGDGRRKRTRAFTELQSHYLFEDRFGRPGKGNDKGKVEGMVGYVRRNFLVPIPTAGSFAALNAHLEARCLARMDAVLRGHTETIGQRMERDLEALLPLPPVAYDACDQQASRVSSMSLVRYRTNDYSVPVAFGHREVLVKGYVDEVVISCGAEVIARHTRSYEQEDFIFDPIHYLPLLERKTGALDQAAPSQGWDLPSEYATLRQRLEARLGRQGKREFVRVLRLMEDFSHPEVHQAVKDALRLGAVGFDAVKHLLLCKIEGRPPRLDLELYPHLPQISVRTTRAGDYLALRPGVGHRLLHSGVGSLRTGQHHPHFEQGLRRVGRTAGRQRDRLGGAGPTAAPQPRAEHPRRKLPAPGETPGGAIPVATPPQRSVGGGRRQLCALTKSLSKTLVGQF